jgi:hypothetical protein
MDGKLHWRTPNLIGRVFGGLTVTNPAGLDTRQHHRMWMCRCTCGKIVERAGADLQKGEKRGRLQSCGCLVGVKIRTHGMSKHPAYAVWRSMNDRCKLPTHQAWANYGGRGISVCDEWQQSFEAFWRDMGPSYVAGLDLDRRDNDGGYSKENCRWVTRRMNTMNKRNTERRVDVRELARATGIGVSTIAYRLHNGWPVSQLAIPPDAANRRGVATVPLTAFCREIGMNYSTVQYHLSKGKTKEQIRVWAKTQYKPSMTSSTAAPEADLSSKVARGL